MKFLQPGSWADRTAKKVRSAWQAGGSSEWLFLGSCVELDGPLINFITDERSVEISYDALAMEVELTQIEEALDYNEDFPLKADTHVTYHCSRMPTDHPTHPGVEVLYFDHSGIEYIWVHVG